MKIGIISMAYDDFDFDALYKNVENYFLPNHSKSFYFFTNKTEYIYKDNVNVYYSNRHLGLYTNIKELIPHIIKDNIQLLFFIGFNNKFNITSGSSLIPEDNTQYSSLNKNNETMFYNLEALLEHIHKNQDNMVYGSYQENFINLIEYLSEKEEEEAKEMEYQKKQEELENREANKVKFPEGIIVEESDNKDN